MLDSICTSIDEMAETIVDLQRSLVAIPALGPRNGGQGELNKARFLMQYLKDMGFADIRRYDAPDDSVSDGIRPNIAAVLPGADVSRTLWIISHTDIVPPGDLSLWKTDPYALQVDGDTLIGRGVEDNHQGLVSGVLVAKALLDAGTTPPINLGLLMVADEETGSHKGLEWIVNNHPELFGKNDLFLVPDFGESNSAMVEVAEKSMLWLKITVEGKQCHGSTPDEGINSLVAASALVVKLRALYALFPDEDEKFEPAGSTFEPTKKEANVENINTIPGKDVFYVDCRVLPHYALDDVLARIREIADHVEKGFEVKVGIETVQREDAAPATGVDTPIVRRVLAGVKAVYGVDAQPTGVGGGTVAAFLRRAGHPAVVWSTLMHNAHQPNETSSIKFTLGDAKVMAHILCSDQD